MFLKVEVTRVADGEDGGQKEQRSKGEALGFGQEPRRME